jgi:uncharacterized protein YfbU (UPF0304 family)
MNQASRVSYIEREYKKWEEKFEIPFELEFNVKALLSLQHQFMELPEEHVKTKADVMSTITRLQRDLNLKPKRKLQDNEKREYLFIVENAIQKLNIEELLINSSKVEQVLSRAYSTKITTDEFKIHIKMQDEHSGLRGLRADTVLKIEDGSSLLK